MKINLKPVLAASFVGGTEGAAITNGKKLCEENSLTSLGFALAATASAQKLPTAETIESHVGKLETESGYPTKATVGKLCDEVDFQRGCQCYIWALPMVSINELQVGNKRDWGIDFNTVGICNNYTDPSVLALTGNNTTIYAAAFVDLSRTGRWSLIRRRMLTA